MDASTSMIRSLNSSDLPTLDARFPQPHPGTHKKRLLAQENGKELYSCVVVNGAVAAIQLVRWDGPNNQAHRLLSEYPEIGSVFVLPEFRKRGFASALLSNSEALIKNLGYEGVGLIIKDENEASIRLHTKAGYKPIGIASPTNQDPDKPRTYFTKIL